jgi:dienelactone hydrolase
VRRAVVFVLAVLVVLLARPASHHARAAGLLVSFSDPDTTASAEITEQRILLDGGIPANVYRPAGKAMTDLPGVVLVHGVHHLGIEEPRLNRFARSVAQAGVVVLAPEIMELSDYRVAPRSIDTVGKAVKELEALVAKKQVGVMGMSFGGGVSLLAAADERFKDDIAFVVAVGGHGDLARVSAFFATDPKAHEYGATVLVYTHVEDFFPAADVPAAQEALRLWLHEARDDARRAAKELSSPSRAKVEKLFAADVASLRPELLAEIERLRDRMKEMSPEAEGRLANIRANVYLLHGEGDNVIPASETLSLAKAIPPARLRSALVTPAIQHVELTGPTAMDKWDLVHFMGQVLEDAAQAN